MLKHMKKHSAGKISALLLALLLCVSSTLLPGLSLKASAAAMPTSLGLVEHGIRAYNEGWKYEYGGKRVGYTDCAGLIYVYYNLLGLSCPGGATSQGIGASLYHGDIKAEGMPRIHGLLLTQPEIYGDPYDGEYGHIGIYTGNGYVVENTSPGSDMHWKAVTAPGKRWNAWHVFDNGTRYPVNGWYALNGAMYHYTNGQYDVNGTFDGYTVGADGIATQNGAPIPVSTPGLTNQGYVSASVIADYLRATGLYDGRDDSTWDIIGGGNGDVGGGGTTDPSYNGSITANEVRLRSEPTLSSSTLNWLYRGDKVSVLSEVNGDAVNGSTKWYKVETPLGQLGYVFSSYVSYSGTPATPSPVQPSAPSVSYASGIVSMTAEEGCDIYYTTDGSTPGTGSLRYDSSFDHGSTPLTYRAVAVKDGLSSSVTLLSVMSNGSAFTDLNTGDWFFSEMDIAVSMGIFKGNGNGTLTPNNNITRGEFVKALANMVNADLSGYEASSFSDVPSGEFFSAPVAWAVDKGYIHGYSDNTFRPWSNITREEMCQIIANFKDLSYSGGESLFVDDNRISDWASDAVYACKENDIVNGTNNVFNPQNSSKRCEVAAVLARCA